MNNLLIVIIVLAGLALVAVLFVVGLYNKLVALRNGFKNAYAQIDVQLKRRYDLIPNLVETAKGYLKHERGTLEPSSPRAMPRRPPTPARPPIPAIRRR